MLDDGGAYDALEVGNSAAIEVAMRRAKLVDYNHAFAYDEVKEKSMEAVVAHNFQAMADHAAASFGTSAVGGNIMCRPALGRFVAGEVDKGQSGLKQFRKARVEADLVRKSQGGGRGRGKK